MSFQWPIRVYIEDTDLGGIVYYVNYLKFMERARTELLRHFGYSQQYLAENDVLFVVTHVEGRYLKPAKLDDELLVSVAVERASGVRVTFLQKITRASDSVLLCQAKVDVACVSASHLKPQRWPANMLQQLTSSSVQQLTLEEK
ncbi:tol-pal system-associated acyl-CoA thioesterase [Marinobacterium sediminicola]|uniref:4-hydroxybenzoyl-CoA thioesterase n=1 Tax=Marinobacterium sediminicola TaxID=518898 RepID=A0ABY1RX52_9GAMM|nr:tol-pal system-associated acyl-CoA thioesterase [Marinobacterium sediminicola]ULG67898.1 tol-pal system-associated acyl-CoA thioesterase [Marinobacterium sediminicola]SMR71396.1 4-hydroxybenzoyl-CoA thioesterase [Marinobacterium sediminicola]